MILNYSGGPNVITRVPVRGRKEGPREEEMSQQKQKLERWTLKVERGAMSRGIQVPLEAEKGKARGFPLESPEGTSPVNTLTSAQ